MTHKQINISEEFSKYPGGRLRTDGPYSGETFREDFLVPALEHSERVILVIDGVMGYGSSFLEECFGGLRRRGKSLEEISKKLEIEYKNPAFEAYKDEIWEYIKVGA